MPCTSSTSFTTSEFRVHSHTHWLGWVTDDGDVYSLGIIRREDTASNS